MKVKLFPEPHLESGEIVQKRWLANKTQSQYRAVGGRLYLTTHRLIFKPHILDEALGGEMWIANLSEIATVGLQRGELTFKNLFNGGLRKRLRIDTKSGDFALLVIDRPELVQWEISEEITTAKAGEKVAA